MDCTLGYTFHVYSKSIVRLFLPMNQFAVVLLNQLPSVVDESAKYQIVFEVLGTVNCNYQNKGLVSHPIYVFCHGDDDSSIHVIHVLLLLWITQWISQMWISQMWISQMMLHNFVASRLLLFWFLVEL